MNDRLNPDDLVESPSSKARPRWPALVGAVAAAAAAVVLIPSILPSADVPPSTTTLVEATPTTTSSTTSIAPTTTTLGVEPGTLTARFSPFVVDSPVSRINAIPESPPVSGAAAEFYVDPTAGDDRADGSASAPVATLEAARRLARAALRTVEGDVVVYLRGGVHQRTDAFELTFQDSGRDDSRMIYRSYPGEQAIVEGGVPVGDWSPHTDEIVVASVPVGVDDMRQFFAGGKRQQRARTPQATGEAISFVKGPLYDSTRNVALDVDSDLVDGLTNLDDLELVYVGSQILGHGQLGSNGEERLRPSWKSHRLAVTEATDLGNGTTRFEIASGGLHHASERGYAPLELLPTDPFYLENALELLDEPGEWFFDSAARLLYWWPESPGDLEDTWIPQTEVLLNINGSPARPIRNVTVEGIAFRHSGYLLPNETGYVVSQAANWFVGFRDPDWMTDNGRRHPYLAGIRFPGFPSGAIQVDSARDIAFVGNVFSELGAVGIVVHNDVRRIDLTRNIFSDIGAAALVAGHPVHDEIDHPIEGMVAELLFSNNVVERSAAEFYASVGVQLTKVEGATVAHNLFRDMPYSALSIGWGWNNNPNSTTHRAIAISNNYFENVVHTLYDGAPVYLLGPVAEPGAARSEYVTIEGNFANNSTADTQFRAPTDTVAADFAKRPGVQLDEGSRNVFVADNVFAGMTVWLQVTSWRANQNVPGWADQLALVTRRNWSDTTASVPSDLGVLNANPADLFATDDPPAEVIAIIEGAGLEAGIQLPPLP